MGWLSKFFGLSSTTIVRTTFHRPLVVAKPRIGFLNLLGQDGELLVDADRRSFGSLFRLQLDSERAVPPCDVLLIYCRLNRDGRVEQTNVSFRDLIEEARAYVAVVASDNDGDAYVKSARKSATWSANIVMTIHRKDPSFGLFFRRLFESMFDGKTMPVAWVELAPQVRGLEHQDCPEAIFSAEAGQVVFATDGETGVRALG